MAARDAARHDVGRAPTSRPADVDVAELYDGFSFTHAVRGSRRSGSAATARPGRSSRAASASRLDGELPLNTHGGQLSAGRLHGYGFLHEACVQLWGEAGDRQVPRQPEVAVAGAGGGPLAASLLLTTS